MNKKFMDNISKTNWEKVDALTEEEIDTSDILPLTEEFLSKSKWWKPRILFNTAKINLDIIAYYIEGVNNESK